MTYVSPVRSVAIRIPLLLGLSDSQEAQAFPTRAHLDTLLDARTMMVSTTPARLRYQFQRAIAEIDGTDEDSVHIRETLENAVIQVRVRKLHQAFQLLDTRARDAK